MTPAPDAVSAIALPAVDATLPVAVVLASVAVLFLVGLNALSTAASGSVETIFS